MTITCVSSRYVTVDVGEGLIIHVNVMGFLFNMEESNVLMDEI